MKRAAALSLLALVVLAASANGAVRTEEARAQGLAAYVTEKVRGMMGGVQNTIGSHWGNAKVEEAEAELPGGAGEIEYVRVRGKAAKEESGWDVMHPSGNIVTRAWNTLTSRLGRAGQSTADTTSDMYDRAYRQAAGIRNKAGQTWDEAMQSAYDSWRSSRDTTKETWDQAKAGAYDTWSATADVPRRAAEAASSAMRGAARTAAGTAQGAADAVSDTAGYIGNKAAESWYRTLGSAYGTWATGRDRTKQNWDDAKKAAWKTWKNTEGSTVGAYDATKDAAADAYERGLQGAYDAWEGTKGRSGQTWDAALDSFNWLFGLTSRSPEDALSSAWERWQATKAETGETWDAFKRKTLEQYEEGRKKWFQGADDRKGRSWFDHSTRGWESWLRSAWHRSQNAPAQAADSAAESWESAKETAKRGYEAVASAAEATYDQMMNSAKSMYESGKGTTGETLEQAQRAAFDQWSSARAFAGGNWNDATKAAERYWKDTKGKTKVGYEDFVDSLWSAWVRARVAGGSTWDEMEQAASDYYRSMKGKTKKTADDISRASWSDWVSGVGGRGGDWEEVKNAAERRWKDVKHAGDVSYRDFMAQTRDTYDNAVSSSESWLHNVSDAIACQMDKAKCRAGSVWRGLTDTLHITSNDADKARKQAHQKVDELARTAHKEAAAEL